MIDYDNDKPPPQTRSFSHRAPSAAASPPSRPCSGTSGPGIQNSSRYHHDLPFHYPHSMLMTNEIEFSTVFVDGGRDSDLLVGSGWGVKSRMECRFAAGIFASVSINYNNQSWLKPSEQSVT